MSWSTPVIHATGDVVSASDWNINSNDLSLLISDTSWTTVTTFENAWGAGSPAPAYTRQGGIVFMRGQVSGGVGGTNAFQLASGYWPSQNTPVGGVTVTTAGQVQPGTTGTNTLTGVIYPTT